MERIHFKETDSTSTQAQLLIRSEGVQSNTVISADIQTAARGSRGRAWDSGLANVAASFILVDLDAGIQNHMFLYAIALATRDVIAKHISNRKVELKWPNDIIIDDRKVSGSLHEIERSGSKIYWIAGIGINVNESPELDTSKAFPAIHLAAFPEFDRCTAPRIIDELEQEIENRIHSLNDKTFSELRDEYLHHAYKLNHRIKVSTTKEKMIVSEGVFRGIADDGCLMLETDSGVKYFSTADVFPSISE